jgi:hypothetical protein
MRKLVAISVASAVMALAVSAAPAAENYETWPVLKNPFESTGGGGIMIDGYKPVIVGTTCVTDFTATEPKGKVYDNTIVFEAVAVQGGTLCTKGKWRAKDGSAMGTTPFQVFIRDGVVRRSP